MNNLKDTLSSTNSDIIYEQNYMTYFCKKKTIIFDNCIGNSRIKDIIDILNIHHEDRTNI